MRAIIVEIVEREARLCVPAADLTPNADLFALGLTPYSAVRLMLALERAFGVEFAREDMKRETVRSLATIERALRLAKPAAAA